MNVTATFFTGCTDLARPGSDTTVVSHYDITTGQWREVSRTAHPADDGIAACIGCGCTDDRACPGGCWWLDVDRAAGKGVCCYCEEHLQAFHAQQAAARLDEQEAQARERLRAHIDHVAAKARIWHNDESLDIKLRIVDALQRHRHTVARVMHNLSVHTVERRKALDDLHELKAFMRASFGGGRNDPPRHRNPLGLGSGVSAELCGKKFSGVIFDEIGPDRRARPRGARP